MELLLPKAVTLSLSHNDSAKHSDGYAQIEGGIPLTVELHCKHFSPTWLNLFDHHRTNTDTLTFPTDRKKNVHVVG